MVLPGVGCSNQNPDTATSEVLVLAASSTSDVVETVCRAFEQSNPTVRVRISTGASNALASQITAGAPAHLFLSADASWAERVREAGCSVDSIELLRNSLVLVVPTGNPSQVSSPEDLVTERVHRVALAGESVPAGTYAEDGLRSRALYDALVESKRIVRGSNVRVTLAYVERGEVDAGVVYATDALISDRVEVVYRFRSQDVRPIEYPLVLLRPGADQEGAKRLFVFFQSKEAGVIFEQSGFEVVSR
jgi:molybdate transport system substrate-binding protein